MYTLPPQFFIFVCLIKFIETVRSNNSIQTYPLFTLHSIHRLPYQTEVGEDLTQQYLFYSSKQSINKFEFLFKYILSRFLMIIHEMLFSP